MADSISSVQTDSMGTDWGWGIGWVDISNKQGLYCAISSNVIHKFKDLGNGDVHLRMDCVLLTECVAVLDILSVVVDEL